MMTRLRNRRGAIWTGLGIGAALGLAGVLATGTLIPGLILLAMGLVVAGSPISRTLSGRGRSRLSTEPGTTARQAVHRKRAIIVGAGEIGQSLAREFQRGQKYEVVGFVDDLPENGGPERCEGAPVLGTRDDLLALAEAHMVDEIIIAEAPTWQQQLVERTMDLHKPQFNVKLVPNLYETAIGRLPLQRVNDIPLLTMAPWQRSGFYEGVRRAFDITFSLLALALTAPLMLAATLAIKLTSRGPVLFRQERVGLDGKTFVMLKLRTMVLDAERDGPSLCTGYDDRRLTFIGRLLRKTRLDEIPQFINVLRGEMSVIGPRPERPCFVEQFEEGIPGYHQRHRIRPGITGLAQVNGHYLSNARDKLRYDLFYIYHRSLWLDARVILRTFAAMIH